LPPPQPHGIIACLRRSATSRKRRLAGVGMADTFTSLERDGWNRNAAAYADVILGFTSQAFAPLLDGLGDLRGRRLLDVASGTGHLAKAAADRGAIAEGVDIAPEMAARAGRLFPALTFRVGSADALPYDDNSFDAVTCCFGLLHMERPERAIAEAFRVLRPGGRFAYTVWHGPAAVQRPYRTISTSDATSSSAIARLNARSAHRTRSSRPMPTPTIAHSATLGNPTAPNTSATTMVSARKSPPTVV
jgi:SAM-dependent methyltransferase